MWIVETITEDEVRLNDKLSVCERFGDRPSLPLPCSFNYAIHALVVPGNSLQFRLMLKRLWWKFFVAAGIVAVVGLMLVGGARTKPKRSNDVGDTQFGRAANSRHQSVDRTGDDMDHSVFVARSRIHSETARGVLDRSA